MNIILSETLSYCFGVRKTLDLAERLLAAEPGRPYYMLGEIVHNEHVIEDLVAKGLRIVHDLAEVPPEGVIILQSHGSPRSRYKEIERRGLRFVDATCPMVKLIHEKARDVEAGGYVPVVIGHEGHEEVTGIAGQVGRAIIVGDVDEVTAGLFKGVDRAGVIVQSTFIGEDARRILERIRSVVPDVVFHDTICQPTKSRQREVEVHTRTADCVIVVGSKRSANTMHLFRIAGKINPRTHLVDLPEAVEKIDIPHDATVFIASGASTPMDLVTEVVRKIEMKDSKASSRAGT
jgi:4-hydroxy-3-methylbut-2-enyl diphosphate reductase